MCSYIFRVVLFRIPGQTRNPEFRPEFPVTNFPEQNRTGIPENSIFRRRISGCPDIRLNPKFFLIRKKYLTKLTLINSFLFLQLYSFMLIFKNSLISTQYCWLILKSKPYTSIKVAQYLSYPTYLMVICCDTVLT